jgi:signal transduction histidine kinase
MSIIISNISLKSTLGELSPDELNELLEKLSNQIQQLSSLIDDFRNVFGEKSLENIEFQKLKENIDSIIKLKYKDMDIDFYISENNFDIKVLSYEKTLNEIFENIIQNSVEAVSENEEKHIYIEFDVDENYLYISVIDNGRGVSEENRDKLFQPYFSTKSLNSSGISLYMAKVSLKNMDGDIEYKPRSKGSEFIIKLPIVK